MEVVLRKIDDIGSDQIRLVKTKGHATEVDVLEGRSSEVERRGNDNADHFASRGVECAVQQSPNSQDILEYKEAIMWYKWLSLLCEHWPKDTEPRPHTGSSAGEERKEADRRRREEKKAVDEERKEAAKRRLLDDAAAVEERKEADRRRREEEKAADEEGGGATKGRLRDEEAAGEAREVAASSAKAISGLHSSHCLKVTGDFLWCNLCGCYGQQRFKDLRASCKGSQHLKSKAGQLAKLRKGCHPLTGMPLGKARAASSSVVISKVKPASAAKCRAKRVLSGSRSCSEGGDARSLVCALARPIYRTLGTCFGKMALHASA